MTDSDREKILHLYPVQIIEDENCLLLRRGNTELAIEGSFFCQATRVIFRIINDTEVTKLQLISYFSSQHHETITQLIESLVKKNLVREGKGEKVIASQETSEERFYWHFRKEQENTSVDGICLIGINCLSLSIYEKLQHGNVENITFIDDVLLRDINVTSEDGGLSLSALQEIIPDDEGYRVIEQIDTENPLIIAASPYGGLSALSEWNTIAVNNHYLFLPVSLCNMVGKIGPLVKPYDSPCLDCLISRENSHIEDFQQKRSMERTQTSDSGKSIVAFHPAMLGVLAETAVFEVMRYLNDIPGSLVGSALYINMLSQTTQLHRVLKAPRCRSCSSMHGHATLNIFQRLTSDDAWDELEKTGGYRNGS